MVVHAAASGGDPSVPQAHVVVFFMGGTIQSDGIDRLELADYLASGKKIAGSQLIRRIPEHSRYARVTAIELSDKPSTALGGGDLLDLLQRIDDAVASHAADGIVIAHGTNTLEETAFFLHMAAKTPVPIVLCGAMRPASAMSGDGDLNLLKAIQTAASPVVRGMGVLVAMNDCIFSARDAVKDSTYRINAFSGRDLGPIGFCDSDGRILTYHAPVRPHTHETAFDPRHLSELPRVAVLVSHIDAEHALIAAAVAGRAAGIVMAGSGAGGVSPAQHEALVAARAAGVAICIASRIGSGRVARRGDFQRHGFVTADNLNAWKARILLSLALTCTRDPEQIQAMFDRY